MNVTNIIYLIGLTITNIEDFEDTENEVEPFCNSGSSLNL
jgi:hypothetical protein